MMLARAGSRTGYSVREQQQKPQFLSNRRRFLFLLLGAIILSKRSGFPDSGRAAAS